MASGKYNSAPSLLIPILCFHQHIRLHLHFCAPDSGLKELTFRLPLINLHERLLSGLFFINILGPSKMSLFSSFVFIHILGPSTDFLGVAKEVPLFLEAA